MERREALSSRWPRALQYDADPRYCTGAATEESNEDRSASPTLAVEYDPHNLAAGVDTDLEAAVALLLGSDGR